MKRTITTLFALMFATVVFSQQDTIAKWTFPTGDLSDTMPDLANLLNQDKYIFTTGGTSAIVMKNGSTTKAAQVTNWDSGQDTKSWQIEINTTGYDSLRISSKQNAGDNNPGPRDFKLQYKLGTSGNWNDVTGGEITVDNEWTSGALLDVSLPPECKNQTSVFIRWIMTSNFDINGDDVLESGKAKIDDIIVIGSLLSAVGDIFEDPVRVNIFPNPCTDKISIKSKTAMQKLEIYDISGMKVYELEQRKNLYTLNTEILNSGLYFLKIYFPSKMLPKMQTIIVR